jgi:hypothetical protein
VTEPSWGQIAYEAYVEHCGGQSINGDRLPSWAGQSALIQAHWDAAGLAVMRSYRLAKEET